jgi:adhesin transport system membrane fusion protein
VVQSLEGGILADMRVKEGDTVQQGRVLATLDDKRFQSASGEIDSKILSLKAAAERLRAELTGEPLTFPKELSRETAIIERERQLYQSHKDQLDANVSGLTQSLALRSRELELVKPLLAKGAASQVEAIRIEQDVVELKRRIEEAKNQFQVTARENYTKTMAELESNLELQKGRQDQLARTTLTAPVTGIVKNIEVTTVGGVIQPGGPIMEIVPIEDQLLIEARVSPRDIAFIRPGMDAVVKLTAYDYSIYGALEGTVERISPDTLIDEIDKRIIYYRVYVRTDRAWLENKAGQKFQIIPGMVASVELKTGAKTVFQYLVKPLNKLRESMRER